MNFYQGMLFLEGFRVLPEHAADARAAVPAPQSAPAERNAATPAACTAAGGCG